MRDSLTGEVVPYGTLPLFAMHGFENGRSIPMALHRRQMGTDDAYQWSRPFAAFIGDIIPNAIHDEWRAWRQWWDDPYILSRLDLRFGQDVIRGVVAQVTYADSRMPSAKAKRNRRRVMRAVRARGGLNPWDDRQTIGRKHYPSPE